MSTDRSDCERRDCVIPIDSAALRSRSKVLVDVVLVALVSLHLFVCGVLNIFGMAVNDVSELLSFLWIGTFLFQPALLACWFALGVDRFFFRLSTLLILMGSFAVASLWGACLNEGGAISTHELSSGVVFPIGCLVQTTFLLVMRCRRWRLTNPLIDEPISEPSKATFTLTQFMVFIAVAAIPLALAGSLLRRVTMIDSSGWMEVVASATAFAAVVALVSTPVMIASLGVILATEKRPRFIALVLILALLTVAMMGISVAMDAELVASIQIAQGLAGYCGAAVLSFLILKCCGYRLTRCEPGQTVVANVANDVPRQYRSFVLALSLLGLSFVVLLFPARYMIDYRRAHSAEFDWRKRGVSVSLSDGLVTYARIFKSSANQQTVPNVLLEELTTHITLRDLNVSGSAITDAQLELIGSVANLEVLDVSRTSITDAGIQHLVRLVQLKGLNLIGTRVSAEGVQRLQMALPDCKIQSAFSRVPPTQVTVPAEILQRNEPPK